MKISDIPNVSAEYDFIFALCTFLDEFYTSNANEKLDLIMDEPISDLLDEYQICSLAATAHKLASDNGISIPEWALSEKYIMPYPVFAFNTDDKEYQEILKTNTPYEFKVKNLYLGANVLKRV